MAITAHQASNIRLLFDNGFDTFAIAAEFKLEEHEVYNYVAAWIERKAARRERRLAKWQDTKSIFAALDSKTESLSASLATASMQQPA